LSGTGRKYVAEVAMSKKGFTVTALSPNQKLTMARQEPTRKTANQCREQVFEEAMSKKRSTAAAECSTVQNA
jgi:hypothetical protein